MSKTTTRREEWTKVLSQCGGKATSKDGAIMAIQMGLFTDLRGRAEIKALQADMRKHLSSMDEEGSPVALACEWFVLGDDGVDVTVTGWVQVDLCTLGDWVFSVRERMKGIRGDAKKAVKLAHWGLRRWGNKATKEFRAIEREFDFDLFEVAGEDDDEEPTAAV